MEQAKLLVKTDPQIGGRRAIRLVRRLSAQPMASQYEVRADTAAYGSSTTGKSTGVRLRGRARTNAKDARQLTRGGAVRQAGLQWSGASGGPLTARRHVCATWSMSAIPDRFGDNYPGRWKGLNLMIYVVRRAFSHRRGMPRLCGTAHLGSVITSRSTAASVMANSANTSPTVRNGVLAVMANSFAHSARISIQTSTVSAAIKAVRSWSSRDPGQTGPAAAHRRKSRRCKPC
jgi:hypothetical protein